MGQGNGIGKPGRIAPQYGWCHDVATYPQRNGDEDTSRQAAGPWSAGVREYRGQLAGVASRLSLADMRPRRLRLAANT